MNERGVSQICHQSAEKKKGGLFSHPSQEKNEVNLQKGRFRMEVVLKPQ